MPNTELGAPPLYKNGSTNWFNGLPTRKPLGTKAITEQPIHTQLSSYNAPTKWGTIEASQPTGLGHALKLRLFGVVLGRLPNGNYMCTCMYRATRKLSTPLQFQN